LDREIGRFCIKSKVVQIVLLLSLLLQTSPAYGNDVSTTDWLVTSSAMGVAVGLELYGKSSWVPEQPRFTTPNSFDNYMRNKLWLGPEKQESASTWSDRFLFGVSMSSLLWGPALADDPEMSLFINSQVFAVNSIVTNVFKIGVARERPYHHFKTHLATGPRDFTSFFSGHSSVSFSQAVTNAMILSRNHPENETFIWSTLLGTASLTAYLRVAGDMHYFSDILIGALAGSAIAWIITDTQLNRLADENTADETLMKRTGKGTDFMISFNIPLG